MTKVYIPVKIRLGNTSPRGGDGLYFVGEHRCQMIKITGSGLEQAEKLENTNVIFKEGYYGGS